MKISPPKLFKSPIFLLVETTYLIFLPLLLILFIPKIMLFRTFIMFASLGYIAVVMHKLNISVKALGLQKRLFSESMKSILPPAILYILSILFIYFTVPSFSALKEMLNETAFIPLPFGIAYYVLLSVPLQEIIFFGFYLTRLTYVTENKIFLCLYCSLIFMLIHTPYMHGGISILIGTFFLGLILSSNFLKYRNIYTLIITHWCVGTLIILLESLRL
ncbi:CPBP family intramembrane metalloprotease [Candidatus Gottesmanbacteria bacterium]|nr:CPBP family intramembrane metalloprotease [Candidatus Gottesmanbacteria bacterium]